jgi:capsular polysaccharide export protein
MNNSLRQRVINVSLEKRYQISPKDEAIFELFQRYIYLNNKDKTLDIEYVKKAFIDDILKIAPNNRLEHLSYENANVLWGMQPNEFQSDKILKAIYQNRQLYFGEDAFLRCICGVAQMLPEDKKHYQIACGYILDDLTAYIDSTHPSRMELIINSDFVVTDEQKKRAREIIDKLIKTKISKYNNQPIYKPNFGRVGVKKVLVVDQSYKDYSILKGGADDNTFKLMLDSAIKENPEADILIKTHPDAIGSNSIKPKCYYQNTKAEGNIYKITDGINPISMLEYVNKVYVCSSQFGFEALMAGKEVHTFGLPFYANWGLTIDNQKLERRTNKRTLEELFYIAYIYMAAYINPKTNKPCEIEEAIDYLIEKREEYFQENNIRCEL